MGVLGRPWYAAGVDVREAEEVGCFAAAGRAGALGWSAFSDACGCDGVSGESKKLLAIDPPTFFKSSQLNVLVGKSISTGGRKPLSSMTGGLGVGGVNEFRSN